MGTMKICGISTFHATIKDQAGEIKLSFASDQGMKEMGRGSVEHLCVLLLSNQ